jgi:hypothetical protein
MALKSRVILEIPPESVRAVLSTPLLSVMRIRLPPYFIKNNDVLHFATNTKAGESRMMVPKVRIFPRDAQRACLATENDVRLSVEPV